MVYPKKLTLDQELEIFGRVLHGERLIDLAPQYNVCPVTIRRMIKRYKNSAYHDSARAAAALYYKEKLPTQNRVTHPARPLSESSTVAATPCQPSRSESRFRPPLLATAFTMLTVP